MFGVKFVSDQFRKALITVTSKIEATAHHALYLIAIAIRDEMRVEGKPSRSPVQWDSDKQRKAYFASNGFGRGIPTKRTGQAVSNWRAIKVDNGAETFNPLAHIGFISGRRQSRIHRGRWILFEVAIKKVFALVPEKLKQRIRVTIQEQGFTVT